MIPTGLGGITNSLFMGQILFFAPVSLIFAQSESHVLRFALSENFSGRVCFLFRTTNFNLLVRPNTSNL